jgi:hypothetical protein
MSMDTIENTGLTQVLANVGHTGASQVFFELIFVSYLFLDIQSITNLTKTKPLEYCMFEGVIKKKGQLRYK